MKTPDDDSSPGRGTSVTCPKCGANRTGDQESCSSCGIVFVKWYARQRGESPNLGRTTDRPAKRWLLPATVVAIIVVVAIVAVLERAALTPVLRGEDVIVTFEHGGKCRLANWRFRYTRRYSQTEARGNILIVGRPQSESRFDSALRVFDSRGNKVTIARDDLRTIELSVHPDPENSFKLRVSKLTLTTASGVKHFETHQIPKYSRTRVLVPDAKHYYPPHYDDDYMSWASAFVYLVGEPTPDCGGHDSFNLTNDEFRKPWTPVHFDFPG